MKLVFLSIISITILFSCSKEIIQHKLSVNVTPINGGSVTPPSGSYEKGQSVQLLATPASDYVFKEWKGDLSGAINPTTLIIDKDKVITGSFEKRKFLLNLTIEGSGTVKEEIIGVSGRAEYPSGTTVRLTAVPAEGWTFRSWTGDITNTINPLDVKVVKPVNLKVAFETKVPLLTISNSYKGNIEIYVEKSGQTFKYQSNVNQKFEFGDKIRLRATNAQNSYFVSWNGTMVSISPEISFVLDKDYSLNVDYIDNPWNTTNMKYLMRYLYSKDIKGKPIVIKNLKIPYFNWSLSNINVDQDLDYLCSENFVVWWDKRYNHSDYAIDLLRWSEFAAQRLIENGFNKPNEYDDHKFNLFITRDNAYGPDVFPENMGQASHFAVNGGPNVVTYPFYNNFQVLTTLNYSSMDIIHETTHVFQANRTSYLDDSWYIESTAEYFQSLYLADQRFGTLRHIPQMLMSSYLRPWDSYRADGIQHLYGLHLLLHYLDWEGIINSKWVATSFSKIPSNKSPFEYLATDIPNFKNIFLDFSMHAVAIDFKYWTDKIIAEKVNLLKQSWWKWGDTSHWLTLKNSGTSGVYKSPENTNETWSFSSIKIENSSKSTYLIDFKPDQTNYRLGLVILVNGKYTYSEIGFTEKINLPDNSIGYIVFVNMPNDFRGQNKYPFKIKIDKI